MKTVLKITRIWTGFAKSPRKKVRSWFRCAAVEADIAELDDDERDEFMAELGLEEPGLNRVIRAGYRLLNLQTYFTAGVKSSRMDHSGWRNRAAAAGKIHTDFEKGFIRAQTIAFDDFITYKGEQGAKKPVRCERKARLHR